MGRTFQDKIMQEMYDSMMVMPPEAIETMLRRGGSVQQSAFADGYEGVPQKGIRDYRGSVAYAAWCAGKDRAKKGRKGRPRLDDPRDVLKRQRWTTAEWEQVERCAATVGDNPSDFVREAALQRCRSIGNKAAK